MNDDTVITADLVREKLGDITVFYDDVILNLVYPVFLKASSPEIKILEHDVIEYVHHIRKRHNNQYSRDRFMFQLRARGFNVKYDDANDYPGVPAYFIINVIQ